MTNTIAVETEEATAPEAEDAPQRPTLSEIDLYLLAKPIAEALAGGWAEDTDDTSAAGFPDKSIRLVHPDGRTIGIRLLWQGQAVQTFAVGGPKTAEDNTDNRLPKGVRYSAGVHFREDPLEEIVNALRTVLLPAFDGYRPRLRANGTRIQPTAEQSQGTGADADQPALEAAATPATAKASSKPTPRAKPKKAAGRQTASTAKRNTKRRTTPATA
ncbi:hypothetical protein [Streptomyces noursei]|uniref:hypothetical protein n=1 Tax=Streptomyces noursei TaxID=1971 RepID=UPI00167C3FC3|nr:hypothetical protein [Streptomyces noursei]MCZ1019726.1 hypothetical protein [Streptomyces noursei]